MFLQIIWPRLCPHRRIIRRRAGITIRARIILPISGPSICSLQVWAVKYAGNSLFP